LQYKGTDYKSAPDKAKHILGPSLLAHGDKKQERDEAYVLLCFFDTFSKRKF